MVANKEVNFKHLYKNFSTSLSKYDCGQFCAPLNNGEPVCCSVKHAVPVMEKTEFKELQSRSDLWRRFLPKDATDRKIVKELPKSCMAAICKGAKHCERDNRSLACRAFPFYPYLDKENNILGLATYWIFEDRCWVISNMAIVERDFIHEFISSYKYIMDCDPSELETFRWQSAQHRRIFSRWNRSIYLIASEGGFLKILPKGKGQEKVSFTDLPRFDPYKSEKSYRKALGKTAIDPKTLEKLIPYR